MSTMASSCCGAILISIKKTDADTKRTAYYWCCARCGATVMEDKRRFNFKGGVRVRTKNKTAYKIKGITKNKTEHRPITVTGAIKKALEQPKSGLQVLDS